MPRVFNNRRLVGSVGKALVCRAEGRGFEPWPDQNSGSLFKITEKKVLPL